MSVLAMRECGVLELMRSSRSRAFEDATLELFTRSG